MKYIRIFGTAAFSVALALAPGHAFGQKDHGGGGKHGGGGEEHGNRGGGGEDRGNRGGGEDHGNRGGGEGHGNGGWKHQEQQVYQPQAQPRQVWQQQVPVYQGRENGNGRGNGNGRWNRGGGEDRSAGREERRVYENRPSWGGGFIPPGQIRSQQVHERNAERKAYKEQEKAYRKGYDNNYRYDQRSSSSQWLDRGRQMFQNVIPNVNNYRGYVPNSGGRQYRSYDRNASDAYRYSAPAARSYNPGYYGYGQNYGSQNYGSQNYGYDPYGQSGYGYDPNGYGYDSGQSTSWKQQILRTLISSVLGGGLGGSRGYASSSYDPYYANNYASGPTRYAYAQPNYYGGYAPQYAGYGQSYLPYSSYGQQSYLGDPYGGYDYPNSGGGLLNSLPIGGLFGQSGSGGFVTQMLSGVIANGYLQGLINGGSARRSGLGEDAYYDPYVSDAGVYDPYSYSIGENRRLMSEGYDLGYEDAVSGRNQYNPNAVQSVDLVSLLLGNVLNLG